MRPIRILIADSSDTQCWALQMNLQEQYHVCVCTEAAAVAALAKRFVPEIAVVDLDLFGLGCVPLVKQLERELPNTAFVLTSTFMDLTVASGMGKARLENYLQKPFTAQLLEERIAFLTGVQMDKDERNAENRIARMLMELNMPVKLHGYRFAKAAVRIMAQDPRQSITKELYPAVAAACGATAEQVERDIRRAISVAWKNRNEAAWQTYFRLGADGCVSRPTNAQFICTLAEHLRSGGNAWEKTA